MVKTAFCAREQAPEGRGAIPFVGRAVGLEIVNTDFVWRMHIPPRFGKQRWRMASGATGLAREKRLAAGRRNCIKTASGRLGNMQGELVELQGRELAGDQVCFCCDAPHT